MTEHEKDLRFLKALNKIREQVKSFQAAHAGNLDAYKRLTDIIRALNALPEHVDGGALKRRMDAAQAICEAGHGCSEHVPDAPK